VGPKSNIVPEAIMVYVGGPRLKLLGVKTKTQIQAGHIPVPPRGGTTGGEKENLGRRMGSRKHANGSLNKQGGVGAGEKNRTLSFRF